MIKKTIYIYIMFFTIAFALVVGIDPTRVPFAYYNEKQELVGFDIDFFKQYEKEYEESISYKEMKFTGLLNALTTGKIDILGSAITVTEERLKQVNFSDNVYESKLSFLGKIGKNKKVNKNAKIGVVIGTPNADYLTKNGYENLTYFDSTDTLYLVLENNKVDYIFHNNLTNKIYIKNHKGFIIYEKPIENATSAYPIAKNDTKLKNKLNTLIKKMEQDSRMQELKKKYDL